MRPLFSLHKTREGLWLLCCGKAPLQYFQPNERAEGVKALKDLAGRVWV